MSKSNTVPIVTASALAIALLSTSALGAQVYVQPIVSVKAQHNSNVELDSDDTQRISTEGYFADAATVIGIATPRSDSTIMPRLVYRYYPDESRLDRLEAFLDFTTRWSSERSKFSMFGRFEHRDQLNAERSDARYDEGLPTDTPTTDEEAADSGRTSAGSTRDMFLLLPSFTYELTQRTDVGVTADLQRIDYSPEDTTNHVDFDYYQGKAFVGWELTQRARVALGGFASQYDAINIDSQSTSYGASADFAMDWSTVVDSTLSILYQRSDIEKTQPTVFEDKANAWGAVLATTYTGQVSRVRFTLGRSIIPSGSGGLYESDSARIQYDRDLSERWQLMTAARYLRYRALSQDISGNDRDYTRAQAGLRWMVTRTWFAEVGYEYTWQKYESDQNSAADNSFALRFGYRGLPRQR